MTTRVFPPNGRTTTTNYGSGATAGRPTTGRYVGTRFLDETLGYIVRWNGTAWVNPMTGAVV